MAGCTSCQVLKLVFDKSDHSAEDALQDTRSQDGALGLFGIEGDGAGVAARFQSGARALIVAVAEILLTVVLTFSLVRMARQ